MKTKEEQKEYLKKYYQENKEKLLNRQKLYYLNNKEDVKKYYKKYSSTSHGRKVINGTIKRYTIKYPLKRKANYTLNNLIKRGLISKIKNLVCLGCGKRAQQYHHPDYNEPLRVFAFCKTCHDIIHKIEG